MRARVQECKHAGVWEDEPFGEPKFECKVRSAKCRYQATKFFGSARTLSSKKLLFQQSPIAVRYLFGSVGVLPSLRFAD